MIEQQFMVEIANFVKAKIDRIVLNGTYSISEFLVKEVTNNILAINYFVPASDVSLITSIELRGPEGVVSFNDVNIPITADQRMIQEIEITEG